jgi:DNA-binding GntR family transcriptional regulator
VLARLRADHERVLERVAREGNTPEVIAEAQAVDWGMHDTIIDALGNEIISNAYRVNAIKTRLIRAELVRIDPVVAPVMREHLGILEAIETRDGARAAAAISAHIDNARNRAMGIS